MKLYLQPSKLWKGSFLFSAVFYFLQFIQPGQTKSEISLKRSAIKPSFCLSGETFMTGPVFQDLHFFIQYLYNEEKQENFSEANKLNFLQTCFSRVLWFNCIALFHTCTTSTSLKNMSMEAEQRLEEKCSS